MLPQSNSLFAAIAVFFVIPPAAIQCAFAHSPYYSQSETLQDSAGRTVSLKVLNGDGIFFADPQRAVVVDEEGRLLATSMMSEALFAHCSGRVTAKKCRVYDQLSGKIFEPKKSDWRPAQIIERDGRPLAYPEYGLTASGFEVRNATMPEIIRLESLAAITSPVPSLFAIGWWLLGFYVAFPIFSEATALVRPDKKSFLIELTKIIGRILFVVCFTFITAYSWALDPYSIYFLSFVITASFFIWICVFGRRLVRKRAP